MNLTTKEEESVAVCEQTVNGEYCINLKTFLPCVTHLY